MLVVHKEDINRTFIDLANRLISDRKIRHKRELSQILQWNESALNSVMAGRRPVPLEKYNMLFELYGTEKQVLHNPSKKGIPIYQVSAQASLMDHINQLPEIPSFHIDLPGYQDCDFGLYVFGECMAPTITSGSLVICKKINDKSIIMYGEIYVVRTSDYLIIKRITKAKKESHILLVCDNFTDNEDFSNRYAPVELSRDEIKELFLVKGIVKKTQS